MAYRFSAPKLSALFLAAVALVGLFKPSVSEAAFSCPKFFQSILDTFRSAPPAPAPVATDSLSANSEKLADGTIRFTPARQSVHREVMAPVKSAADRIAAELTKRNGGRPVLIMTRGNSGSGKTYSITHASHPVLNELGVSSLMEAHEKGVINPDTIKATLQIDVEKNLLSSSQVHEEGSYLAKELIDENFREKKSMIIDKRFGPLASVAAIADRAKAAGYRVVMLDVDAPIEASASRILERPVGGSSPNVPLAAVAQGADEARTFRLEVAKKPEIDDYLLFREGKLVAERSGAQAPVVHDGNFWREAVSPISPEESLRAEVLFGDLLNSLSDSLPAETLRPYFPPEKISALANELPDDFGQRLKVSDLRYYVKKGGGPEDHRRLALAVKEYIERQAPGAKISVEALPEHPDRISSVIVRIENTDPAYARRLLGDRAWPFHLDSSDKSPNPAVLLDTREVGRIDPFTLVERDVVGIGDNAPDIAASGSIGHEFVKAGNDLGKIKNSPPLAQVKPRGFKIRFQKGEDSIRFRDGFRTDEAQAYNFGAQVELLLARKAVRKDVDAARTHLAFARSNFASAREFNAAILFHFQEGNPPGLHVEIEGLSEAELLKLRDWSRKLVERMDVLEKEIAALEQELGK